jgi:hypothetical protein
MELYRAIGTRRSIVHAGENIQASVGVALITDPSQHVLLIFDERWGSFTLPMSRRRAHAHSDEPATRAAIRAAVAAVGVPVRLVQAGGRLRRVLGKLESQRELVDKLYTYTVCHIEPHPDFAGRLQVRRPHVWLSPHLALSGTYEPISETARFILRSVLEHLGISARIQHTSALIIECESPERGRQFLMRWNPDWGYALPAKRWQPGHGAGVEGLEAMAVSAAEQVAREELGLDPGTDVTLSPAPLPRLTTHGVSATKAAPAYGAATDYVHHVFQPELGRPQKLRSKRPLAWVTQEEIHGRWSAGSDSGPSSASPRGGRISQTGYELLVGEGRIAAVDTPEALWAMKRWSRIIERRLKAAGNREERCDDPKPPSL